MKKIAIVMFELDSEFGGILGWILQLCHGLREIGCEPKVFYGRPTREATYHAREVGGRSAIIDQGEGLRIRVQSSGARGKLIGSEESIRSYVGGAEYDFRDELSEYDGVILTWPPSYTGALQKYDGWLTAMRHKKPLLVVNHDCHWKKFRPWLLSIRDNITCLVASNAPGQFEAIKDWPGPIANIFNPFDIAPLGWDYKDKRMDWVCNLAFFKKWKHNDDGIRAAPYVKPIHMFFAGSGIEISNLRADPENHGGDKWRERHYKYFWHSSDPDGKDKWDKERIWDVALNSGYFHYLGLVDTKKALAMQKWCGGLTEFAWHPKWGEHWNRCLIEGMIHRCLPFARPLGISNNKEGRGQIFSGKNVVLIPEGLRPKKIAEIIRSSMQDSKLYKEVTERNAKLMHKFDRKEIAKQYVSLLSGDNRNIPYSLGEGSPTKDVQALMDEFCIKRFPRRQRFPRLRKSS